MDTERKKRPIVKSDFSWIQERKELCFLVIWETIAIVDLLLLFYFWMLDAHVVYIGDVDCW